MLGDLQGSIAAVADKVKALDASQKAIRKDLSALTNLVKTAIAELKNSSLPMTDFIDRITPLEAQALEHGNFLQHVKEHIEISIPDLMKIQNGRLDRLEVMAVTAKDNIMEVKSAIQSPVTIPSKRARVEPELPALPAPTLPAPILPAPVLPAPVLLGSALPVSTSAPAPAGSATSYSTFGPSQTGTGVGTNRQAGHSGVVGSQVPTGDVVVGQYDWGRDITKIFENLYLCLPPDISRSLPRPDAVRRAGKDNLRARFNTPDSAAAFVHAWNVGPITPPEDRFRRIAHVRASHVERSDSAFAPLNSADDGLKF
jgi:hypothetical protein